jgi:hypothetical protein
MNQYLAFEQELVDQHTIRIHIKRLENADKKGRTTLFRIAGIDENIVVRGYVDDADDFGVGVYG